MAYLDQTFRK
jgi:hypothetical protein